MPKYILYKIEKYEITCDLQILNQNLKIILHNISSLLSDNFHLLQDTAAVLETSRLNVLWAVYKLQEFMKR